MGFLSREPKIGIEEFCRQFYDSQIFDATIAGEDMWSGFLETVFKSVTEVDESFSVIDLAVFKREMTALRLELFGLAWGHKFKQQRFTIPLRLGAVIFGFNEGAMEAIKSVNLQVRGPPTL